MVDNIDLRKLIEEILRDSREMVLATCQRGKPWVATLVFGHDAALNLYWISDLVARHSNELTKNPRVAAAINKQPTGTSEDKGLQVEGEASLLP